MSVFLYKKVFGALPDKYPMKATLMENFDSKEDAYSLIFSALKHPIRRAILKMLADDQESYSDLLNELKIDSPKLNYHIQGLNGLVDKTENGKYELSAIGEAAIGLMKSIEHPTSHPVSHAVSHLNRWDGKLVYVVPIIMVTLGIVSIIVGASLFLDAVLTKSYVFENGFGLSWPSFPNPQATAGLFWLASGIVLTSVGGVALPFIYIRRRLIEEEGRIGDLEKSTKCD